MRSRYGPLSLSMALAPRLAVWLLAALPVLLGPAATVRAARPEAEGGPAFALTVVSGSPGDRVESGAALDVEVVLRNDGAEPWSTEQGFSASSHWLDQAGRPVSWEGPRTAIPGPVVKGQQIRLTLRVVAPEEPGIYGLQWDVVQEHVCWISQQDPTPERAIRVEVAAGPEAGPPSHAFSVLEHELPSRVVVGRQVRARVLLRNDGSVTWEPDEPFNLSYHWLDADGVELLRDGLRTAITRRVEPGDSIEVILQLQAPEQSGRLLLQLDMVHERVCWFSDRDPSPEPPVPIRIREPIPRMLVLPIIVPFILFVALMLLVSGRGAARLSELRVGDLGRWRMVLLAFISVADLLWLGSSMLIKQAAVLEESGRAAAEGATWVSASVVSLLLLLTLMAPRRFRPWVVWILAALFTALLLADLVYLRYFGDVISMASIGAAGQSGRLLDSVRALLELKDVYLLTDLVLALPIMLAVARIQPRVSLRPVWAAASVLAVLLLPGAVTAARALSAFDGTVVQVFQNIHVVSELGLLGYHLRDGAVYVTDRWARRPLSDEAYDQVVAWFRESREQRAGAGPFFGAARGRNLLMVQMESLQGFVIGLEVEGQEITPSLNRLAREGLWYSSCLDQAAQGRSSDAELTSQTSLLPPIKGTASFRFGGNDFVGLAEVLGENGYTTMSAVPFDGAFWNRQVTHRSFGFERSLFEDQLEPGETIGWGLNDQAFLSQMLARLEALERPFCVLLITLSLHHPFEGFPQHHKVLDLGGLEGTAIGEYLHVMSFADRAMGAFIAGLRNNGLLDSTVLTIWGDHGAGFAWSPELARLMGRPFTDAHFFLAERVPLLIRAPGVEGLSGEQARLAGQTDIAPTMLALLGLDPAELPMMGRNLLGRPDDGPIVCRYGTWLDQQHLYVNTGFDIEDGTCYPLSTLEPVEVSACAAGVAVAQRRIEISTRVLRYDLQEQLRSSLASEAGGP